MCLFPVSACVDSNGRLDEYAARVVDAGRAIDAIQLDDIPDVTGSYFVSMSATVAPDKPFTFAGELELIDGGDGTFTANLWFTPLDVMTQLPVSDPLGEDGVAVSSTGSITVNIDGMVNGAANSVIPNTVFVLDADATVQIQNIDLLCGTVTGDVTAPAMLEVTGSPIVMVRVAQGTTGDAYPAALQSCPND